ncbi:MAG: AAA family ATPase [Comamonas sp.]|uniref:AAA family ATPase n=1 Tax=Comamonas sp. TaxID=34028 RepID=UPI003D0AA156
MNSTQAPDTFADSDTDAGTLHLLCGKIASGKSTLARQLAAQPRTVLVSEDAWLAQLYPDALVSIQDYVLLSARLRGAMQPHVVSLLQAGTSVVLDFPSNTPSTRAWARSIFEAAGAPHALHWLQLPDDECKRRLRARNASGEHPFETSDAQFDLISHHFVAPSAAEGFQLVLHG